MLTSGMAVPFALTAAAEALQSREMMQKSLMASNAVIRGTSISQAVALNGELFSDTSIEFISIGEESGSLPEMLWAASLVADDELQTRLKALKVMVEPILLLLVSLLVGCVLFSVASPMVGIISGMPEYF
jgi:type II secretory pathway component PulF